jgi:hypothetical protein
MAFKPNYRFERNERNRQKQAKKEEKSRRQQERKSQPDETGPAAAQADENAPAPE